MDHYAGIDVSLECSNVCVVDANGKIVREAKVASEPAALVGKGAQRRAHGVNRAYAKLRTIASPANRPTRPITTESTT
jgi:hypothetical protein